jgi:protocatechuate 3,4-dioxygenase beta subunit
MSRLTRRDMLASGACAAGVMKLATPPAQAEPKPCLAPNANWTMVPKYMWGAPERSSFLEPGPQAQRLNLSGRILTTACKPIEGARVEFWHTAPDGKYDYLGFRFRGFQTTGRDGRYRLETIMPGRYSPVRHIHYLIGAETKDAPGATLLAHVVEFPTDEEAAKYTDEKNYGHSRRVLLSAIDREGDVLIAHYDIVLAV